MEINRDKDLEAINIKSIKVLYWIMLISIILAAIAFGIFGFVFIAENRAAEGIYYLLIGIPGCIIAWALTKPLIGLIYDVKIMRYHLDNREEIEIAKAYASIKSKQNTEKVK